MENTHCTPEKIGVVIGKMANKKQKKGTPERYEQLSKTRRFDLHDGNLEVEWGDSKKYVSFVVATEVKTADEVEALLAEFHRGYGIEVDVKAAAESLVSSGHVFFSDGEIVSGDSDKVFYSINDNDGGKYSKLREICLSLMISQLEDHVYIPSPSESYEVGKAFASAGFIRSADDFIPRFIGGQGTYYEGFDGFSKRREWFAVVANRIQRKIENFPEA